MSAHTPGEWRWHGRWLMNPAGKPILGYTTADDGIHCSPADAALIACAPELLEALTELFGMAEAYVTQTGYRDPANREAMDRAAKVIAKVTP